MFRFRRQSFRFIAPFWRRDSYSQYNAYIHTYIFIKDYNKKKLFYCNPPCSVACSSERSVSVAARAKTKNASPRESAPLPRCVWCLPHQQLCCCTYAPSHHLIPPLQCYHFYHYVLVGIVCDKIMYMLPSLPVLLFELLFVPHKTHVVSLFTLLSKPQRTHSQKVSVDAVLFHSSLSPLLLVLPSI